MPYKVFKAVHNYCYQDVSKLFFLVLAVVKLLDLNLCATQDDFFIM